MKETPKVYVNTVDGSCTIEPSYDEPLKVEWIGGVIPRLVVMDGDDAHEFLAENLIQVNAEDIVTPIEN